MSLAIDDLAPDFELPSQHLQDGRPGKKYRLGDFRGKPVVLAFYPLDFSPVCTRENTCFRDDLSEFQRLGAQVLGISVDSVWTHQAFAESVGIDYPLLADFHPKGAVAELYGLYAADFGVTARATVLIDKNGKVAWLMRHPPGEARDNADLLDALRQASG